MSPNQTSDQAPRRADAARNRSAILEAARAAFAEPGATVSMAEVARRAQVGMATLYRNFPGREQLLEALFAADVDAVCASAAPVAGVSKIDAAEVWLRSFAAFLAGKHQLAGEILKHTAGDAAVLDASRTRILAAGRPLIEAAQAAHELRDDLSSDQVLDLVLAVAEIRGEPAYRAAILDAALDGLRRPPRAAGSAAARSGALG